MAVVLSLVVMSGLAQSSPLYDELEGAPGYLESQVNTPTNIDLWPPDDWWLQQAGNTVPMIGKKASSVQADEREAGSASKLLYLLRFLDLGLR